MDHNRVKYLFQRYVDETCTGDELLELKSHLANLDQDKPIKDLLDATWNEMNEGDMVDITDAKADAICNTIIADKKYRNVSRRLWPFLAAAMLILITFSIGLYIYNNQPFGHKPQIVNRRADKIQPGGNKAVLTLADGSKILLDSAKKGVITVQGSTSVNKGDDGRVIYTADNSSYDNTLIQYNTISTPRGGQYQIILPDGTIATLNAESSLRFPTAFKGNERRVELTGEGYFEVVKNKNMPFKVEVNTAEVEVLGTQFNIMAYLNESSIKTTLLEGSVSIKNEDRQVFLNPGQQARISRTGSEIKVQSVNTEEVVSWKNGYFMFNNENIQSVMRKISRWYDVEIDYPEKPTNKNFSGTVSRFEDVSEVLSMLELTGIVHFKIQGRRIVVMP